jgi:hypothetical protein
MAVAVAPRALALIAYSLPHSGHGVYARRSGVELTAAVIGYPDAVRSLRNELRRISRVQNALDDEWPLPPVTDRAEVIPIEAGMEIAPDARGDRQSRAGVTEIAAHILELRQAAGKQAKRPSRVRDPFDHMPQGGP